MEIKKGQIFNHPDYGLVQFMKIDVYYGEVTVELKLFDPLGKNWPFLSDQIKLGFIFIE